MKKPQGAFRGRVENKGSLEGKEVTVSLQNCQVNRGDKKRTVDGIPDFFFSARSTYSWREKKRHPQQRGCERLLLESCFQEEKNSKKVNLRVVPRIKTGNYEPCFGGPQAASQGKKHRGKDREGGNGFYLYSSLGTCAPRRKKGSTFGY